MEANDLQKRLFKFAIDVIKAVRKLPKGADYLIISRQLVKSATSSGANYDEAQGAVSKADFTNKVRISLREMRESNYWLRIIQSINETKIAENELNYLLNESKELKNILGAIVTKAEKK